MRTLDTRVDGLVAVRLGLEESTPLVYLERLRLAADQPLAIDRAWLPAKVAAPLLDVDFSHTALYTELDRRCGIRPSQGTETVSAVVPTPTERKLLGITDEPGVAALSLRRLSCFSGHAVEWRHTLVRGDRFSVTAEFRGADWCPA